MVRLRQLFRELIDIGCGPSEEVKNKCQNILFMLLIQMGLHFYVDVTNYNLTGMMINHINSFTCYKKYPEEKCSYFS